MSTLKSKIISAPINGATVESLVLQTNNTDRVTIDASGNVTSAGGVTAPSFTGTLNGALSTASGSAPSYSARAWVNFNGTGTVAIRASGNVSSITDGGVGLYTANFATAMPDVNYAFSGGVGDNSNTFLSQGGTFTSSAIQFYVRNILNNPIDEEYVTLAIFR